MAQDREDAQGKVCLFMPPLGGAVARGRQYGRKPVVLQANARPKSHGGPGKRPGSGAG